MTTATPAKLGSGAEVDRSTVQRVLILAVCSKIADITRSARSNTALDPRLGAQTGLNDGSFVNNLTGGVPNGECQIYLKNQAALLSSSMQVNGFPVNTPFLFL